MLDSSMARQQKWTLKKGVAELDCSAFRLRIDTSNPELGGQVFFTQGATAAALFQVGASVSDSQEEVETYCRGSDLISRYTAGSEDPITRELYWRVVEGEDEVSDEVVSVETIYSLQTDLLDSVPQPSVPSVFAEASSRWFLGRDGADADADADAVVQWNECSWEDACFAAGEEGSRVACVISLENGSSVLQTVYPPDLRGIEMNLADTQTEIHWQLRSDFLEKGVIRRLRLLTVLGSGDSTEKELLDAADHFYRSELPLTV